MRFSNPGIPDDCRLRTLFGDADFTAEARVVNFDGSGCVKVNSIDFRRDTNGGGVFGFLRKVGDFIEVLVPF